MSAFILYLAVTLALLWLWSRCVRNISRAAALVLIALPLLFTGRALILGRVYAPIDLPFMSEPLHAYRADFGLGEPHNASLSDLYQQIIPWKQAVRASWAKGEWPLLNPYMLCGDVLAASAQPAPYDPFELIALLIPLAKALTFGAAITFFIAAFSAFVFARALACREPASLVAAAAWMCSASIAFMVGWPLARAWALLPFVLFAVHMVVHETSLRSGVVLTTAFTLEILAGHPETLFHVIALGALYGIFELFGARASRPQSASVSLDDGGGSLEEGHGSLDDSRVFLDDGRVSLDDGPVSLDVSRRPGRPTTAGGTPALRAIAIAGAAGLIALGITAVFLMPFMDAAPQSFQHAARVWFTGQKFTSPPGVIARRALVMLVPWDKMRYQEPDAGGTGFVVIGFAIAALVVARKRRETWFFFTLFAICALAGINAPPVAQILHSLPLFDVAINQRFAFAADLFLAMLAALAVDSLKRPHLILGLLLIERIAEVGNYYPSISQRAFYPYVPTLSAIPQKSDEPFRIAGQHYMLIPDAAAFYGLEDARGYSAMNNWRLRDTFPLWSVPQAASFNVIGDPTKPFLAFLNIRYLLTPLDSDPGPMWNLVATDKGGKLYENNGVLPRAFIPQWIWYRRTKNQVRKEMLEADDFRNSAWVEVPEYPNQNVVNGSGTVKTRRANNGYLLDANMQHPGWIIVSETAWDGWRAYIDGRRVQHRIANLAFIGVHVPEGRHKVQLIFLPDAFTRGRAISFATLGLIAISALSRAAIRGRRRARRPV
ncbi:MAG TPA: YfhO family protein [Thermoanaerobaculia bacterium]|nr:YfhO family protein [Thermoanaerobaculia bacterium]